MTNCEQLADEYMDKFPRISREDHMMIINGALTGDRPAMSEEGFKSWYNDVGQTLASYPAAMTTIRRNPHFIMHRETMVLGGDWLGTSILDRVKKPEL